jgi:hypothetical protein
VTHADDTSRDQSFLLRLGAVCLILGSAVVLGFRLAHGDLPTNTGEEALGFVAARPLYPVVHFGDWLGCWSGPAGSLRWRPR